MHLWDPRVLSYPWLSGLPALNQPFGLAEYDKACVASHAFGASENGAEIASGRRAQQMVFVECTGAMTDVSSQGEVRWVSELAAGDPRIGGIVAHASLENDSEVSAHLEWLASNPLVKGVRRLLQGEVDPHFCLQPSFLRSLRRLPSHNLSFDICVYHYQLEGVLEMVARCPEVSFVLDHAGKPGIRSGDLAAWTHHLSKLAAFPNVNCKLSGLITEADIEHWTSDEMLPVMGLVLDEFGSERVMFGSDWPVVNLAGSLGKWMDLMGEFDRMLDEGTRQSIYCNTALRVYRL